MKKTWMFVFLGVAAAATVYTLLSKRNPMEEANVDYPLGAPVGDKSDENAGAQRITGATAEAIVTGHDADDHDPLPADHRLTEADAKAVRAESRKRRTSPGGAQGVTATREQMYRDPESDSGGESGTQSGPTGRENQNPIGRHK